MSPLPPITQHATATVAWPWTRLLETAERFHESREFGVAIVIAQTACEVVVERAIANACEEKVIPEIKEFICPSRMSCSLANPKTRKLYNVLTNDSIAEKDKKLWGAYECMVTQRHDSVHRGKKVTESESREGLDAAKKLVEHVASHNRLETSG